MSRQVGSLHRSISHPANLHNPIPIIPLFAFPPPESPHITTSSGMVSNANSDITAFHIICQFQSSDLETPDEFANSEPSPSTFSQPPFRPIHSQAQTNSPLLPLIFSKRYQHTPTLRTNAPTIIPQIPRKSHMN